MTLLTKINFNKKKFAKYSTLKLALQLVLLVSQDLCRHISLDLKDIQMRNKGGLLTCLGIDITAQLRETSKYFVKLI